MPRETQLHANSPACHQTATLAGLFPAMQNIGQRRGAPRRCFKPLPSSAMLGAGRIRCFICTPSPGRTAGLPLKFSLLCHKTSYVTDKSLLCHQARKRRRVKTDQTLQDRDHLALGFIQILNVPVPSPTNLGPLFRDQHAVCKALLQTS